MKIKFLQIKIFLTILGVLILGAIVVIFIGPKEDTSGKYNDFATCLKDKGAVFYGASWCSHCRATKALFGSAKKFLPYVECATSKGGQTQECKDKKIMGYPTWEFTDATRLTGEISLITLAGKTGCNLPK